MPIYEYRCKDCGNVAEFQMKFSDPHPQTCPTCGHNALSKIMSLPSFQLKGGGWYADAYDGKSNKAASSPKSESSDSAAASGSASSSTSPSAASSAPSQSQSQSTAPSGSSPSGSKESGTANGTKK
jgi:putative FmdB family regulatory protein